MPGTLFALVLFGCADAGDQCVRLDSPVQTFATRAQCEQRQEAALLSDISLKADFPTVTARCRAQIAGRAPQPRRLAARIP